MKIAYIILAHRLPNQLVRLVSRLEAPSVSFFIHIDANTDDATYSEMLDGLIHRHNVHLLPRHRCSWGGLGNCRGNIGWTGTNHPGEIVTRLRRPAEWARLSPEDPRGD